VNPLKEDGSLKKDIGKDIISICGAVELEPID
jgi:hypothetical protein